jgi:hypothetical protein
MGGDALTAFLSGMMLLAILFAALVSCGAVL